VDQILKLISYKFPILLNSLTQYQTSSQPGQLEEKDDETIFITGPVGLIFIIINN